jgi:hypothetical protein
MLTPSQLTGAACAAWSLNDVNELFTICPKAQNSTPFQVPRSAWLKAIQRQRPPW